MKTKSKDYHDSNHESRIQINPPSITPPLLEKTERTRRTLAARKTFSSRTMAPEHSDPLQKNHHSQAIVAGHRHHKDHQSASKQMQRKMDIVGLWSNDESDIHIGHEYPLVYRLEAHTQRNHLLGTQMRGHGPRVAAHTVRSCVSFQTQTSDQRKHTERHLQELHREHTTQCRER